MFYLAETMLNSNGVSNKPSFWKQLQKFHVFGKNCKNFMFNFGKNLKSIKDSADFFLLLI